MENSVNNCKISSKDSEEEHVMHSNSGNIKFTPYSDENDVIEKLFEPLRSRYQENLETSMKGSDFIFDSVQLMYYKCRKVNFIRGGSYTDSADWIKSFLLTRAPYLKIIHFWKSTSAKSVRLLIIRLLQYFLKADIDLF